MRVTRWEHGIVYYIADGKKLRPANMPGTEREKALRRLAELEDQEEERQRGCATCNDSSCSICENKEWGSKCGRCIDKSEFLPPAFCKDCGKRLTG